jgi:DNA-binding SARP family transcriptional activator
MIGVLGPVWAMRNGTPIDLGAPRQRAVLARLVAGGGHVVSVDRLVEDLWSGDPPPRAQAALQVYVSNLRRALEPDRPPRRPARILVTAAPGYALRLPTPDVDAWRFEAALRTATRTAETHPQAAVAGLDEALACWGGATSYAEFVGELWADRESERLGRLRLTAVEQRAKLLLDLDRADEVILDLDPHVREHPLREQAAMLLAVALYRLGRQAEALDVLRSVRAALVEQLGIDPGPELRSLETDLLRQNPHLGPPATGIARPAAVAGQTDLPTAVPGVAAVVADRPPAAQPPLGRAPELARMRSAADRATGAGLGICWIGAEAGGGKSTLARHLAGSLTADGWYAATGTCPQVEGAPPAWAWHEVVTAARGRLPLDEPEAHGLELLLGTGTAPPAAARGEYDEFHLRQALAS